VKTYAIDANTSRAPKDGAHSPSWPNRLIIIIIVIIRRVSRTYSYSYFRKLWRRLHKKEAGIVEKVSQAAIDDLQKKLMGVKSQIVEMSKAGAEPRMPRKSKIQW
jgi:hypothetical protein